MCNLAEIPTDGVLSPAQYVAVINHQLSVIEKAQRTMAAATASARRCARPDNLRPALPTDMNPGQVVWFAHGSSLLWGLVAGYDGMDGVTVEFTHRGIFEQALPVRVALSCLEVESNL